MAATKNPLVRVRHIRDEIDAITSLLRGVERDRYVTDYALRRAAERALLIVSEAVKSLPAAFLRRYPEVNWSEVIGLGNVLRHDYHMVDDETIWEILTTDLPALSPVVTRMINDLSSGQT